MKNLKKDMTKRYWWTKQKERVHISSSFKQALMDRINSKIRFRLDLFSSKNGNNHEAYLFDSNSSCSEHKEELFLYNFYIAKIGQNSDKFIFESFDSFERRLINADFKIEYLTYEQFNNLINE